MSNGVAPGLSGESFVDLSFVDRAEQITRENQTGQIYDAGMNLDIIDGHILPAVHLLENSGCNCPTCKAILWMHDLVEDTRVTIEDVQELDMPDIVIGGLILVTKRDKSEDNDLYIQRIVKSDNPCAKNAKYFDSTANLRHKLHCGGLVNKGYKYDREGVSKYTGNIVLLDEVRPPPEHNGLKPPAQAA